MVFPEALLRVPHSRPAECFRRPVACAEVRRPVRTRSGDAAHQLRELPRHSRRGLRQHLQERAYAPFYRQGVREAQNPHARRIPRNRDLSLPRNRRRTLRAAGVS